jgi:hypothetical protein
MRKKLVPRTKSIKKLAEFWQSHDFTDFEDQMVRVKGPLFEGETVVAVRLEPAEARTIKGIAKSKRVKESDLIREWIREKIRSS